MLSNNCSFIYVCNMTENYDCAKTVAKYVLAMWLKIMATRKLSRAAVQIKTIIWNHKTEYTKYTLPSFYSRLAFSPLLPRHSHTSTPQRSPVVWPTLVHASRHPTSPPRPGLAPRRSRPTTLLATAAPRALSLLSTVATTAPSPGLVCPRSWLPAVAPVAGLRAAVLDCGRRAPAHGHTCSP